MQATVEDNLKWGFALYSSPGSFDPECDDPVSMSDFKNLVSTMARCVCEIWYSDIGRARNGEW